MAVVFLGQMAVIHASVVNGSKGLTVASLRKIKYVQRTLVKTMLHAVICPMGAFSASVRKVSVDPDVLLGQANPLLATQILVATAEAAPIPMTATVVLVNRISSVLTVRWTHTLANRGLVKTTASVQSGTKHTDVNAMQLSLAPFVKLRSTPAIHCLA